jgi:hypothetical protein
LPRAAVLRRLQELVKECFVGRVGNAYRVTDNITDNANLPDSAEQAETANRYDSRNGERLSRVEGDVSSGQEAGLN